MMTLTQPQMARHDAEILRLMTEEASLRGAISRVRDRMHSMARDKRVWSGRTQSWQMTDSKVESIVRQIEADGDARDLSVGAIPSELLGKLTELNMSLAGIVTVIDHKEETYRADPWKRYIECINADGHIHSWWGCKTLNRGAVATSLAWRTELSGVSTAEAVDTLGPMLCTVCFPSAPVDWCRKRSDVTRAQREADAAAKKAARDARNALKNLAPQEQFRSRRGDRVTTVAACKTLVRDEIEARVALEWARSDAARTRWDDADRYAVYLRNMTETLDQAVEDAQQAERVLTAREEAAPGTGAALAEISKIRTSKEKSARKAWGLN